MGGPVQNSTFAVGVGSAAALLVVWALNTYAHANIPAEEAGAINTLVALLLSHFVPDVPAASPKP